MAATQEKTGMMWELTLVTIVLTGLAHVFYALRGISWIAHSLSTIVAVLFLYGPTVVLWWRRRPVDFLDQDWPAYRRSVLTFFVTALIVFPPFLVAAHSWQTWVFQAGAFHVARFPQFWTTALFQILMIALPEEFYFRGYFQSTLDRFFSKRWLILGVPLGWGWVITAAVFALAHSVVVYRWWHFSIFFPALLFGYLKERTKTITAPILFHAASNLVMDWFGKCYF